MAVTAVALSCIVISGSGRNDQADVQNSALESPPATFGIEGDTPRQAVGVNAVTLRLDDVRTRQFDEIAREGFPAVRLHVEWPLIEHVRGEFDWASTDAQINQAAARGLKILGVITYTPAWAANAEGRRYIHPHPADLDAFTIFTRLAAERYHNVIRDWEIWNEPNVTASFAPRPDVAVYAQMLKSAYTTIKGVNPNAVVITGGTSPAIDTPETIAPARFIQGLFDNGCGSYFDAVAMHPYSAPNLLSESAATKASINHVGDVLLRNGRGDLKIWFTEFGASTAPGLTTADGHQVGVTDERQSEILVDGITYLSSLRNSGPIFLFDHRDVDSSSNNVEFRYGMLRSDWSSKPSLAAVLTAIRPQSR